MYILIIYMHSRIQEHSGHGFRGIFRCFPDEFGLLYARDPKFSQCGIYFIRSPLHLLFWDEFFIILVVEI